jgi:type VI protein secretion system component Hcp
VPIPYFQCPTSDKLSKYKHLGKAGTQEHIDAVMSVFRRSLGDEIHRLIYTLDNNCLLDISSGSEQESEQPLD